MQIYVSDRQTGKTYRTIEWFLEAPDRRAVICIDYREACRLREKIQERAPELGGEHAAWTKRIVWPQILNHALRGRTIEAVWIDNLDLILPILIGYWGKIIATSTEPIEVIDANPRD